MARIHDSYLNCAFFLYQSLRDARDGSERGATGFFVSVPWETNKQRQHVYAATNTPCITNCRDSVVIRATRRSDASLVFIETDPIEWDSLPGNDISVRPIAPDQAWAYNGVPTGIFVTPDDFRQTTSERTCLGPGDKVFMLGRFISHDGKTENHPSARFGNISMNAAPIWHRGGYNQESIAVDMRAISGYSGSPVFVYWEFGGANLPLVKRSSMQSFLALLGIDWGHIEHKLPVLGADGKPLPNGEHVRSHTSMACVVPAWRIADLLGTEKFKRQRMQDEADAPQPAAATGFAETPENFDPRKAPRISD